MSDLDSQIELRNLQIENTKLKNENARLTFENEAVQAKFSRARVRYMDLASATTVADRLTVRMQEAIQELRQIAELSQPPFDEPENKK